MILIDVDNYTVNDTVRCRYIVNDTDRCRYTVNDTLHYSTSPFPDFIQSLSGGKMGVPVLERVIIISRPGSAAAGRSCGWGGSGTTLMCVQFLRIDPVAVVTLYDLDAVG